MRPFPIILLLVLLTSYTLNAQKDLMIEPPHWWVSMEDEHLQIMINGPFHRYHGVNMDDYEGVRLDSVTKTDSNYFFLDLTVSKDARAGKLKFKIFGKGPAFRVKYELHDREPESKERIGFNSSDVMYLITPDRFSNGDPGNDDMEDMIEKSDRSFHGGRHGGDIRGIIDHLDYIADMGFTAIWLNPVLENNMESWSYHGYATTDFYRIDPRYGTLEEYKELCEEAEKRNIKVIQDMIENHCGSKHWWIKNLPYDDWINNGGNYKQTSHRHETVQDPYASEYDKKKFNDGWFVRTMPDLNQRNPFLSKYLIQNSIWWIEEVGLDGIRQDTYPYADKEFMAAWSSSIMKEYPSFNIVGEEWNYQASRVAYWQKGKVNSDSYESGLPSVMDFPLQKAICEAFDKQETSEKMVDLYRCLANDFVYHDPDNLVVFADNHDMDRFHAQIDEDFDMWKMGMAYLMTTRGIPQILYGTEILMSNGDDGRHGIIRSDFPGGWKDDAKSVLLDKGLTDQEKEAKDYLSGLLNWRKDCSAVHSGELIHFAPEDKEGLYALFRWDDDVTVMLILNRTDQNVTLPLNKYEEILKGRTQARDVTSERIYDLGSNEIEVPGNTALVLEVN